MDWSLSRYNEIHQKIGIWYQEHGRVTLPWRNTDNPYKIYLSEIMLQQTQVKTVLTRFYFPFLERFPTLKSVAEAPLDDVLKAWEGLGYYTRARNMHKTAQQTNGKLPNTAKQLQELSGIGQSTAHAVASFSFGQAVPILDANVKRILYRFFALTQRNEKILWEKAYQLFDYRNAYLYNQAMMDIGSIVCTHRNPQCDLCPFQRECQGKVNPLKYPEKKVTKKRAIKKHFMLIYSKENRYFLSKNSTKLLGGLWGFPQVESFNLTKKDKILGNFTHHYTHFKLDLTVILLKNSSNKNPLFTIEEIDKLALSGADRKALELLR